MLHNLYNRINSSLIYRCRFCFVKLFKIINFFKNGKQKIKTNKVLIIRLDAIGDYILFRNYFDVIINSQKYDEVDFYFIGNEDVKDIFMYYDSHLFRHSLFIDKKRFYSDLIYHIKLLHKVNLNMFNEVIHPVLSRENEYGDYVINFVNAKNKIGIVSDTTIYSKKEANNSNKKYDRLYKNNEIIFEFLLNKKFTEFLLQQKVNVNLEIKNKESSIEKNIVIVPGAGESFRRWSASNFVSLIKLILKNYSDFKITIIGSSKEFIIGEYIVKKANDKRVVNVCGKTSLIDVVKIISKSKYVISNETSSVHIAAATNTKCICISNANTYIRFNPYPQDVSSNIITIYPKEFYQISENERVYKYRYHSDLNIDKIEVEDVFKIFKNNIKL